MKRRKKKKPRGIDTLAEIITAYADTARIKNDTANKTKKLGER